MCLKIGKGLKILILTIMVALQKNIFFDITFNYFLFIEINASAVSKILDFDDYDLSLLQFKPSGNNDQIRSERLRDTKKWK